MTGRPPVSLPGSGARSAGAPDFTDGRRLAAFIRDCVIIPDAARPGSDRIWSQGSFFGDGWFTKTRYPLASRAAATALGEQPVPSRGSTACIIGWAAILSSPPGTRFADSGTIILPGGTIQVAEEAAGRALHLTGPETRYLSGLSRTRAAVIAALTSTAEGRRITIPD